jgi:hypothetical protein
VKRRVFFARAQKLTYVLQSEVPKDKVCVVDIRRIQYVCVSVYIYIYIYSLELYRMILAHFETYSFFVSRYVSFDVRLIQ